MYNTLFTLVFAIVGISATFMPWVHYPMGNSSLYGYVGDGILTGVLFLFIALVALKSLMSKKFIIWETIVVVVLSLLLVYIGYQKITNLEIEKTTFNTENILIARSVIGFTQGVGLYVLLMAAVSTFLLSLVRLFSKREGLLASFKPFTFNAGLSLFIALAIPATFYLVYNKAQFTVMPERSEIERTFSDDIASMGKCLAEGDYACITKLTHPAIVQSLGGTQKMDDMVKDAIVGMKKENIIFKSAQFSGIDQIETQGSNIQAIISQTLTFANNNQKGEEKQKMLAISEDKGKTWHYLSLQGMDRSQLKKIYPSLNDNLNF